MLLAVGNLTIYIIYSVSLEQKLNILAFDWLGVLGPCDST